MIIPNLHERSINMNGNGKKTIKTKAQWHFKTGEPDNGYDLNDADIHTDVLGSYTGTPYNGIEPEQDVDDL